MCSVAIPVEAHEYIDRARRHCLWRKSDSDAKSRPLVAWRKCTRPKKKGGLGIINLRSQNTTLLLKHLDNFFHRRNIPWVNLIWNTYYSNGNLPQATKEKGSFCWKDLLKFVDTFRSVAQCVVGDGSSVMFWSDLWNGNLLQQKFPRLYSFAKNKGISVATFLQNNNLEQQFYTPPPYLHMPIKNILPCRRSSSRHKSQQVEKINGNTFGVMITTHPQNFTISPIRMCSLLAQSFGFGILAAPTKSRSLPGLSLWTDST
jgi:hypothetical protein